MSVCRICLVSNVKLYDMEKNNLIQLYEDIIGDWMSPGLSGLLCSVCVRLLKRYYQFKRRCIKSQSLMYDSYIINGRLSEKEISSIIDSREIGHNLCVHKVDDAVTVESSALDSVDDVGAKAEEFEVVFAGDCTSSDNEDTEPLSRLKLVKSGGDEGKKLVSSKRNKKSKSKQTTEADKSNPKTKKRRIFKETYAKVIRLSRDEQLRDLEKRKETSNYKNSPYRCELCYKGYLQETAFNNHMILHDTKLSGERVCELCKICVRDKNLLRKHVLLAHERKFLCVRCPHVSSSPYHAHLHETWHNGKTYQCKECSKVFQKPTTYYSHLRLTHKSQHICQICGECFLGERGLYQHRQKSHKDILAKCTDVTLGPHCKECDIKFYNNDAWYRHLVTSANHNLQSMSDTVGDTTLIGDYVKPRPRKLNRSLKIQTRCKPCDMVFESISKYSAHYRRAHMHNNSKSYMCDMCGKYYTCHASLLTHQKSHMRSTADVDVRQRQRGVGRQKSGGDERRHKCDTCFKTFKTKSILACHTATHTGLRPYACKLCDKQFTARSNLHRHIKVHTGAKPFSCEHCGKTFSQSNSVKLHIHTVHFKLPTPYGSKRKCQVKIPLTYDQTMVDHTLKMLE